MLYNYFYIRNRNDIWFEISFITKIFYLYVNSSCNKILLDMHMKKKILTIDIIPNIFYNQIFIY